jgi:hypothetical protein
MQHFGFWECNHGNGLFTAAAADLEAGSDSHVSDLPTEADCPSESLHFSGYTEHFIRCACFWQNGIRSPTRNLVNLLNCSFASPCFLRPSIAVVPHS